MNNNTSIIPDEAITAKIYFIRGKRVMLDNHLSDLYGVHTKVLNQSVKRNMDRFPEDFMFQLTEKEYENLRSQFVTSSWGGRRTLPYVFTEQGVAMLSSVLNSATAIKVNIQIIRVFTRMRELLLTHKDILLKLEQLELNLLKQDHRQHKVEEEIQLIFQYLKQLLNPQSEERKEIGFKRSGGE